jgi:ribosome maturation factor RimP
MTVADRVRDVVLPVLATHEVDLYDLDVSGSLVRVVVNRSSGLDLDALGALTRAVSRALDDADPIAHRYTLEVTSPGVERRLRRPEHYKGAVGEVVKVRTLPGSDGERRVEGTLVAADDDGITLALGDTEGEAGQVDAEGADGGPGVEVGERAPAETEVGQRRLAYDQIERARTVFEWGTPAERPGHSAASPRGKKKRERRS